MERRHCDLLGLEDFAGFPFGIPVIGFGRFNQAALRRCSQPSDLPDASDEFNAFLVVRLHAHRRGLSAMTAGNGSTTIRMKDSLREAHSVAVRGLDGRQSLTLHRASGTSDRVR